MLIGRGPELEEIGRALEGNRLVTLTGPGGVGKTALARAVVDGLGEGERLFVDLTAFSHGPIVEGIAGSLRFRSFDDLRASLHDQPGLIVLDNCEHVLDAAASAAGELLTVSDGLRLLATSREALNLPDEWVVGVAPLATDGSPSPAEELFRHEATRRGFGEAITAGEDIGQLVRRLDGLPLALELAASRLAVLSPREMLEEVSVRLDLLSRGRNRGPDRHQSLAAAIGWSYATLDADHKRLLSELSVLPAPFSRSAAAAVASIGETEVVAGLATLVERSLLVHHLGDTGSGYRMLDTIRLFASERLGEDSEAVEQRLMNHAIDVADRVATAARAADPGVTGMLAQGYPILRWALLRCVEQGDSPANCAALVAALWWLEDVGHQGDAADAVERVVARWTDSTELGPTWGVLSGLHRYAGRRERAERAAERAIAGPDALGRAYGLRTLGQFARTDGRWDQASALFEAGIDAAERAGERAVALEIELHRAVAVGRSGDLAGAIAQLRSVEERAEGFELVGVVGLCFRAWLSLGVDMADAADTAATALAAAERLTYHWGIGSAHLTLGGVALHGGDPASAAGHARRAIEEFGLIRDRTGITVALLVASGVFARVGDEPSAHAASAARSDHLSGQLGRFECDLFTRLGAVIEPAVTIDRVPTVELVRRLAEISAAPSVADAPRPNRLTVVDGVCTIEFHGRPVQLPTNKGLVDLATLLSQPGREVAALDLMGAAVVSGDAGPRIDPTARRQYEARIRDLQEEIDTATDLGDLGTVEARQSELDHLVSELTAAYGLGGRARRTGEPAERARSAVTHRIRDAIDRLEAVDPALGSHLRHSVKTGRFCAYRPDTAEAWTVVAPAGSPTG